MRKTIFLILIGLLTVQCQQEIKNQKTNDPVVGLITEKALVVSARNEASEIGAMIMKQGGNAFDAMVATEMALAVFNHVGDHFHAVSKKIKMKFK